MDEIEKPTLIPGGLHVDARGTVSFVNDFNFKGVERFYTIQPHRPREPRGWVGHRRDRKWFSAMQGSILIAIVRPDDWEHPATNLPIERIVLSGAKPAVLTIPPGYATGMAALTYGAILTVFSAGALCDAGTDDFRFPVGYWPIEG